MLDWAMQHSQLISDVLNLGMLLVWIIYLHVIVIGRRRQARANILITIGSGSGLAARCLVSNMSAEAIYIHSIILRLETEEGVVNASVTEIDTVEGQHEPSDLNLWTRQGPLQSGKLRDLGTFDGMIEHALLIGSNGAGTESAEAGDASDADHEGHRGLCLGGSARRGGAQLRRDPRG